MKLDDILEPVTEAQSKKDTYDWDIVWKNVLFFVYLHYAAVRGLYLVYTGEVFFYTFCWATVLTLSSMVATTGGSHRLWAHCSYKAKWPLRTLLMLSQTLTHQNHVYGWARNHRVHHKYTDTDADPHNSKRGFFYAHMGWIMVTRHPDSIAKGRAMDLSDLERDPVIMFQKKYYLQLLLVVSLIVPTMLPVYLWGESGWAAWYLCVWTRIAIVQHITFCINSVAHTFGTRPIDKSITARQNTIFGPIALGEGWHNYHHVFPWDYKTAELGNVGGNFTAAFIDFFARYGQAYDLKTVSKEMVDRRMRRTGDGTHPRALLTPQGTGDWTDFNNHVGDVWGWGDKDMSQEDIRSATVISTAG